MILCANEVYAQVAIQTVLLEPGLVGPKTVFNTTLLNSGPDTRVSLDGEVQSSGGEMVLSFRSEPVVVSTGMRSISSSQLIFNTYIYGMGSIGRSVQRFHRLPGGEYRYCLRVTALNSEVQDEYCDVVMVEEVLFLDLVQPWDGDTIDEVRPALTWMLGGSQPLAADPDVRLVLVPMETGIGPMQAMAKNSPLFMIPHVRTRTVAYPAGVPGLERGACYAWQAELLDGNYVKERSEPWGFCVRKHEEPVPNKYVRLDRVEPGAIYEVTDGKIYFRYDEPYASAQVDCSIMNGQGGYIRPQLQDDTQEAPSAGIRSVGVNLYELDLQPYGLKRGYYDLVVRNEKGRARTLKFHVPR